MLNRVFPKDSDRMLLATAAVFVLAFLLDAAGRVLRQSAVWRVGGYLWLVALGLGAVVCLMMVFKPRPGRRRRGVILVLSAVALAALVRWVRGSAGVPADPPLLAAEFVSAALLVLATRRR